MPRHPGQDAGLERYYKRRESATRQAFMDAMDHLLRGEPIYTNGRLTEANLCREAKRSRATLNRYRDIKVLFSETKQNRNRTGPGNLAEKVQELEETVKRHRLEYNQKIRELMSSRDSYAQETYILHQLISALKQEKADLEQRLHAALKGATLRLVTPESESKR